MAQVLANHLWFFPDGSTTSDSLTSITKGVDTSLITAADLAASGVEIECITGSNPNLSQNTEEVYCPNAAGVYVLDDEPTLDEKSELVVDLAQVSLLTVQQMFSTTTLVVSVANQVRSGSSSATGLAKLTWRDSASSGDLLVDAFFWTRMRLTSLNADRSVAKPQLTLSILANGSNSPITATNLT
jgi:hypothetical protein